MFISSNIKELCERVAVFFNSSPKEYTLDAILLLGNVYASFDKCSTEDKVELNLALTKVKNIIHPDCMAQIWLFLIKSLNSFTVLEESNKRLFKILAKSMLSDIDFLKYADKELLIKMGASLIWSQEVVIALIRKHLFENSFPDPFYQFSYETMRQGGTEQNYRYVSRFIGHCRSIPIEEIIKLGSADDIVAKDVLFNLTNSHLYYEISYHYAARLKNLRPFIADNWQKRFSSQVLTSEEEKTISLKLDDLKGQFKEFRSVKMDNRVKGHHELPQLESGWGARFYKVFNYTVLPGIAAFGYGLEVYGEFPITSYVLPAITHGAEIAAGAIMASPILLPLTISAGVGILGGTIWYYSMKSKNRSSKNNQYQETPVSLKYS